MRRAARLSAVRQKGLGWEHERGVRDRGRVLASTPRPAAARDWDRGRVAVLYFPSADWGGTLAYVRLRDGEDGETLLKRFQTSMQRSGILRDLRNRRFFRSKGEQARLDKQRSLRRMRRRRRR